MMATNNILPFCPDDTGTNLLTQSEYAVAADRDAGNQPGIASSKLNNKAARQSTFIASQLAQYLCDTTGNDVLDDANTATLLATIKAAIQRPIDWQSQITNLSINFSVAASAATIAVKTQAGADATSTTPIIVGMRSSTITSGAYNARSITGALSIVIPSSATLGQTNGNPANIYAYLIDNAGILELAVSHAFYPETALVTTTTISSSATSATAIYSTTGRTNVPVRCIGYVLQTQATAGTWATTATQIQLYPSQTKKAPTIQKFTSGSGTYVPSPDALYIRVRAIGGGGGGGGSGTDAGSTPTAATNGGNSTFGSALISAGGGTFGAWQQLGGSGGTASLGTGPIGIALSGGQGASSNRYTVNNDIIAGSNGGCGALGGAGAGGLLTAGQAGVANTGGGGGSGSGFINATALSTSGGGGSGGYVDAIISNTSAAWASSFSYSVGAGGNAGGAGTSGYAGGAGGSGLIEVTEYYQ